MIGIKTAEQKQLAISVLTDARKRIYRRDEPWVCCAIADVSDIEEIKYGKRRYPKSIEREAVGVLLKEEIRRRLGTCTFVTTWLRTQPEVDWNEVDNTDNTRKYRLRWIDSMIAELQQ